MNNVAYNATRRRGSRGSVVRVLGSTTDHATGAFTQELETTNFRLMVKEPTQWSRIQRAQMTSKDVGDTTFIVWNRDVPRDRREAFENRLTVDDYVVHNSKRYQIISSTLEDDGYVITAREIPNMAAPAPITLSASNSMGLSGDATTS